MSRHSYLRCKQHVGRVSVAVLALLISSAAYAAQKAIQWENGAQCEFETKFDPAKTDEERLRNTIDVILGYGNGFYKAPMALMTPGVVPSATDYQQACERERDRVVNLPVLDLPGIEDYRMRSLEQFDDWCRFDILGRRAASGDPSALREFTPSVAKCSRFIDALEGKTDIREVWRGVVEATCQKNSRPDECKANHESAASRPNGEGHIKRDVLDFGWTTCSTGYLKTNAFADRMEKMRDALEKQFRRRFKVKAFPCS
jgi:hypothetical protein